MIPRTPRPAALAAALAVCAVPLHAQRRIRLGPTYSVIWIDDASGASHTFHSFGGTIALMTGDDGETGLAVARYDNLSSTSCERALTFFGLDDNYYPVGAGGIAPFASTELGVARVTEADKQFLPLIGGSCAAAQTSTQVGYGFGLGLRVGMTDGAAMLEGRFFQVPNSAIQSLELRANVSFLFGAPRTTNFLRGTLGPAVSWLIPVSGTLRARGPLVGVRFRRDTKKASSVVGLEVDFAPLEVTGSCTDPGCHPDAVLFAPGYEASLRPAWGRLYFTIGPLLAGVPSAGPDRGVAQGAHAGFGVDIAGGRVLWDVNSRLLWLQRNSGENVFAVQVGVSVSPPVRE